MTSMSWVSGKENIKVANRLLFEDDVIRAVDKHTINDKLDNDISCILEEIYPVSLDVVKMFLDKQENKSVQK